MDNVDFSPMIALAQSFAIPAIATVLLWLAHRAVTALEKHTGVVITQANMDFLDSAIQDGIKYSQHLLEGKIAGKTSIEVKSAIARQAIDYVLPVADTVITDLGLTPESVAKRINAALGATVPVPPAAAPQVAPAR